MAARGRAEAYVAQVQAYRAAPEIYRATKYFEALADVMKNARVYIVNDDARYGLRITNDLKDNEATIDALTARTGATRHCGSTAAKIQVRCFSPEAQVLA